MASKMQFFLATQTPEQLAALATAIAEIQANQRAATATTAATAKPKMIKSSSSSRVKGSKAGIPLANITRAAKRPLNSFMAFRAYYKDALKPLQQKDISPLLHQLWVDERFKAKWAIVAKAYSVIRDSIGKVNVPLDKFFAIAIDHVGIINVDQYLLCMGYAKPTANAKVLTRLFHPTVSDFPNYIRTTNVSVDDLVDYCKKTGHFGEVQTGQLQVNPEETLAMAVQQNASNTPVVSTVEELNPLTVIGSDNVVHNESSIQPSAGFSYPPPAVNSAVPLFVNNQGNIEESNVFESNQNISANEIALQTSGDSYPFTAQFDPADAQMGIGLDFDPMMDAGEFDASFIGQVEVPDPLYPDFDEMFRQLVDYSDA